MGGCAPNFSLQKASPGAGRASPAPLDELPANDSLRLVRAQLCAEGQGDGSVQVPVEAIQELLLDHDGLPYASGAGGEDKAFAPDQRHQEEGIPHGVHRLHDDGVHLRVLGAAMFRIFFVQSSDEFDVECGK